MLGSGKSLAVLLKLEMSDSFSGLSLDSSSGSTPGLLWARSHLPGPFQGDLSFPAWQSGKVAAPGVGEVDAVCFGGVETAQKE